MKASFCELCPLLLGGRIGAGVGIETFVLVVVGHGQQQPLVAPSLDGGPVNAEQSSGLCEGQQTGVT